MSRPQFLIATRVTALAVAIALQMAFGWADEAARVPRPIPQLDPLANAWLAPPPITLNPVHGPLATTTTAAPGQATGGISPELYLGNSRSRARSYPIDIAESTPADPVPVIGQSKRRRSVPANGKDGLSRIDESRPGNGKTVADCMALWDKSTHMTREEWRRTCRRTMGDSKR